MIKIITNFINTWLKQIVLFFTGVSRKQGVNSHTKETHPKLSLLVSRTTICLILIMGCVNTSYSQIISDSDGDGVPDHLDLDDDNDGILDTVECESTSARIITWYNGLQQLFPTVATSAIGVLSLYESIAGAGLSRVRVGGTSNYQRISNVVSTTENQAVQANEYIEYKVEVTKATIVTQIGYFVVPQGWEAKTYNYSLRVSDNNFNTSTSVHGQQTYNPVSSTVGNDVIYPSNQTLFLKPGITYLFRVYFYFNSVTGGSSSEFAHDDFQLIGFIECDTDNDGIPNRLDLDSDNDGCVDALEGDENVTNAQLVTAASGLNVGFGSLAAKQNIGGAVDANGVPLLVNTGGAADTGSATQGTLGQPIGSSQNPNVSPCCTNPPNLSPATDFTKTGISTLEGFAGGTTGWPGNVPNGFIAIESQNKGFVITRVLSANNIPVADRVEGMLVYDITDSCVKLYNGAYWKCLEIDCGIPTN